ncbi:MAG TPA: hypothetical protein PLV45_07880 [bacterium]|nr:hypothetical protein [bacterium]
MNNSYRTPFILLILLLGAVGALGTAAVSSSCFRITQFEITADEASLRTRPLIDYLDQYQGILFFRLSGETLRRDISDFKQVERVTISRSGFSGVTVDITLRRPILMVTNGHAKICLGPGGIPFPYWPEYGELPVFSVPSQFSDEQLLEPDSRLLDFYDVVRHLVSHSLLNLTAFTALIHCDEFEMHLMDRDHSRILRLPRTCFRDPGSSFHTLNSWLTTVPTGYGVELDARFPGTLVIRDRKEVRRG